MKSNLIYLVSPVSRERILSWFPKWHTPEASLQFEEHFQAEVRTAYQLDGTQQVRRSSSVLHLFTTEEQWTVARRCIEGE
ncbi:ras-related protein Rab-36 [Amazona ochrocephala]